VSSRFNRSIGCCFQGKDKADRKHPKYKHATANAVPPKSLDQLPLNFNWCELSSESPLRACPRLIVCAQVRQ
jgi:hypothetical protein